MIPANDDHYDAKDNARKCYEEGIRAVRLSKIKLGQLSPRAHVAAEMDAYRSGRTQRLAATGLVVGWLMIAAGFIGAARESWAPNIMAENIITGAR